VQLKYEVAFIGKDSDFVEINEMVRPLPAKMNYYEKTWKCLKQIIIIDCKCEIQL